jgi:hypothetical protein
VIHTVVGVVLLAGVEPIATGMTDAAGMTTVMVVAAVTQRHISSSSSSSGMFLQEEFLQAAMILPSLV